MPYVDSNEARLYFEELGEGSPILLVHPAGSTASTWGSVPEELATIGRVVAYDRRGYARSSRQAARSMAVHTADAARVIEGLALSPAVVVGTSAGAAIAVDLAARRPGLVRAVVAHEFPWRFLRHLPQPSQIAALSRIGAQVIAGRQADAAETLLRSAYAYSDGTSAWDAFPEEWRQAGRANAHPALIDFVNSIRTYPSARDLAAIEVPVLLTYGSRSPESIARLVRSLAAAIPSAITEVIDGAGHAAPFDATAAFVEVIADALSLQLPHWRFR
jgi:pimeloyl-ACP methyl ester carboxylesterase